MCQKCTHISTSVQNHSKVDCNALFSSFSVSWQQEISAHIHCWFMRSRVEIHVTGNSNSCKCAMGWWAFWVLIWYATFSSNFWYQGQIGEMCRYITKLYFLWPSLSPLRTVEPARFHISEQQNIYQHDGNSAISQIARRQFHACWTPNKKKRVYDKGTRSTQTYLPIHVYILVGVQVHM